MGNSNLASSLLDALIKLERIQTAYQSVDVDSSINLMDKQIEQEMEDVPELLGRIHKVLDGYYGEEYGEVPTSDKVER